MKTVLIYSGGLDSTVLLSELLREGDTVSCLNFQYGSKHNSQEFDSAAYIARQFYKVSLKSAELGFINAFFKSDLLKSGGPIPEGHYTDKTMKSTVVPFRNGIMLAIAVGYAESLDYDRVAIANHAGDHEIYPDCRNTFIQSMDEAARYGTYKNIQIYSPFLYATKAYIVAKGNTNKAPMQHTWSCYAPVPVGIGIGAGYVHCGRCSTCVERIEAFQDAGITDETEYTDTTFAKKLLKKKKHGKGL